jgi:hypothetical protein
VRAVPTRIELDRGALSADGAGRERIPELRAKLVRRLTAFATERLDSPARWQQSVAELLANGSLAGSEYPYFG